MTLNFATSTRGIFAALFLVGCAGCQSRITEELTVVRARDVRLRADESPQDENDGVVAVSDLWSFVPADMDGDTPQGDSEAQAGREALNHRAAMRRTSPSTSRDRPFTSRRTRAPLSQSRPATRTSRLSALPAPKRRAKAPRRTPGKPASKSAARLAREHFLDYPTTISAKSITLYCPRAYVGEVRLHGEERPRVGEKRVVIGEASLTCRELTLRARRIAWIVRDDPDIQIAARGSVQFVSKVGEQVVRENGIRSLLITNDKLTPLR